MYLSPLVDLANNPIPPATSTPRRTTSTRSVHTVTTPAPIAAAPRRDPRAAWAAAVATELAKGLPRARALAAANRNNPGLRKAMLNAIAAINGQQSSAPQPTSLDVARRAWDAAIAAEVAAGVPHGRAVRNVAKRQPALRAALVTAANK